MTTRGLTQKQETFTQNLFKGMYQRDAYIDAYHPTYAITTIDANASILAKNQKVVARLSELRAMVTKDSIATVEERQQILTDIARGNLLDYQEVGADGGYLSIGKDSPHTRAISEITSRTEYDKDGSNAAVVTKVKLHNPMTAIDVLNKMDKIYDDGSNSRVNVNVVFVIGRGYKDVLKEG